MPDCSSVLPNFAFKQHTNSEMICGSKYQLNPLKSTNAHAIFRDLSTRKSDELTLHLTSSPQEDKRLKYPLCPARATHKIQTEGLLHR